MIITAGKFKGRKVTAPDENITRPTLSKVRMSVFNTLQAMISFDGKSFLDMYSGSGIMALEALSRGFSDVAAIEKNVKSFNIIKKNFDFIANSQIKLFFGDSLKILSDLEKRFDVIYIDPPYFSEVYEKSLQAVKSIADGIIILEHVTDIDFAGYKILKQKKYGDKIITFLSN